MLTLLPVFLLLLISTAVFLLFWSERGRRYAWLISLLSVFLVWVAIFALHWLPPLEVIFPTWRPFEPAAADQMVFRWDANAWVLAVCLVGLLLAVILTAPVRFQYNSNPLSWSAAIMFTAIGLLSILSGSPLALVISWTLLDVVEVIYALVIIRNYQYRREALTSFALRLFSVGLLVSVMVIASQPSSGFRFEFVSDRNLLLLIGAVVLRLGVLPLSLKYEKQLPLQNGLTSLMRITVQVSSIALLVKLPEGVMLGSTSPLLVGGILLLIFYAAVMWLLAENEIAGRTFFGLFFSGLAILSVLQGKASLTVLWGVALIAWGGMIFLYTVRSVRLSGLMAAAIFSFSGLPFTLLSGGWQVVATSAGWTILLAGMWVMMITGYVRHAFQRSELTSQYEPYIVTTYTVGLVIVLLSAWLSLIIRIEGILQLGNWWGSLMVASLTVLNGWLVFRRRQDEELSSPQTAWMKSVVQKSINLVSVFLSLNWLYGVIRFVFHTVQGLTRLLTNLFEGEGGVLWSLLLLVLLISTLGGVR